MCMYIYIYLFIHIYIYLSIFILIYLFMYLVQSHITVIEPLLVGNLFSNQDCLTRQGNLQLNCN